MKTCEECGNKFKHKHNQDRARYCSKECRQKNKNVARTERKKELRAKETCVVCGSSLANKRLGTKCCSSNCRNKLSRKNQPTENRKCKQCNCCIDHMSISARYCCESCRVTWNNQNARSRKKLPVKTIPCKCCGKDFTTGSAEYCSQQCRNMKVGEYKKCEICDTKFLTKAGSQKVTCGEECTRLKRLKIRSYKKYCLEMGIAVPEKPKKAKTKSRNTKPRVKKKDKATAVANVMEALAKTTDEPVVFKSEPEPTRVQGNRLRDKITKFSKRRGFTEPDRVKAMQDEWLKKNKPTVIKHGSSHPTPYEGELLPTHTYSQEGERNNKNVRIFVEGGIKDYGM